MMSAPTVAPPAGAWIETSPALKGIVIHLVAPPAGAWIETIHKQTLKDPNDVAPLRARGLKPGLYKKVPDLHVAPPAGAWIETYYFWLN